MCNLYNITYAKIEGKQGRILGKCLFSCDLLTTQMALHFAKCCELICVSSIPREEILQGIKENSRKRFSELGPD